MKRINQDIDSLITEILKEEIEIKAKELSEQTGEWMEIKVDEDLKGGQKKLDVAEPKGKLTAADFKKLRDNKKETKEQTYFEDEFIDDEDDSEPGNYEGDKEAEDEAEALSSQEPTYVGMGLSDNKPGKIFGSFSDEHGWYDQDDRDYEGEFDFDFDEEEFDDFPSLFNKYGKRTKWFSPGERGQKMFDHYREKYGPMKIRVVKGLEEAETEEGNAFTGALAKAKESGDDSFEVDGKKYSVKEARDKFDGRKSKVIGVYSNIKKQREMKEDDDKWIQKTDMKKGALHKKLGVPEGDKIPQAKLKSLKKELMKKAEGDKKLSAADSKLLKQVNLALTLKGIKEETKSLKLTEEELIDLIENIVNEQIVKDKQQKDNISKVKPIGLKKTEKVLDADEDENEDYAKLVTKKISDYLKTGSKGKFEENPTTFPKGNGELGEMKKKAYKASPAVDEYIRDFAYPGLENTKYDEIKPNEQWLTDNLEGTSKTGNNPKWANAVDTGLGKKFNEKRKKNAYQKEKDKSYNRVTQPVDTAGEHDGESSVNAMFKKLESTSDKKEKLVNEDISKMKDLIGYNRKTQ